MVPPVLLQLLLLIESLIRILEAEVQPRLRVFGIPLCRLPNPATRAIAELRGIIDAVTALTAAPPRAPEAPQAKSPRATPRHLPPPEFRPLRNRPSPRRHAGPVPPDPKKSPFHPPLNHAHFVPL